MVYKPFMGIICDGVYQYEAFVFSYCCLKCLSCLLVGYWIFAVCLEVGHNICCFFLLFFILYSLLFPVTCWVRDVFTSLVIVTHSCYSVLKKMLLSLSIFSIWKLGLEILKCSHFIRWCFGIFASVLGTHRDMCLYWPCQADIALAMTWPIYTNKYVIIHSVTTGHELTLTSCDPRKKKFHAVMYTGFQVQVTLFGICTSTHYKLSGIIAGISESLKEGKTDTGGGIIKKRKKEYCRQRGKKKQKTSWLYS